MEDKKQKIEKASPEKKQRAEKALAEKKQRTEKALAGKRHQTEKIPASKKQKAGKSPADKKLPGNRKEEPASSKVTFGKPGTMLYPIPAVMVSCGSNPEEYNIITVAWTGTINSEPPMVYVSIRKSRHSHEIIRRTGEFVINLTTSRLAFAADYCGVKSGRDVNKFRELNLTAVPGAYVNSPMIAEAPVSIECRVTEIKEFPSHDMFIASVLAVHAGEDLFDEKGRLMLAEAGMLCFCHGAYYEIKKQSLGRFGYSVMKPKTRKRLTGHKGSPR